MQVSEREALQRVLLRAKLWIHFVDAGKYTAAQRAREALRKEIDACEAKHGVAGNGIMEALMRAEAEG